jgi:hypothetical protein
MKKKILKQRASAVQRYLAGESPESICTSLGKTIRWLYKWVARHTPDDPTWFEDQSRRPLSSPYRTPEEVEKIVERVRLNLYNKGLFCGNQAIQWELIDMEVQPLPSLSTIGRILRRRELTHRRTGRYTSKGKKYPELPALLPNQTHQVDLVGPCYLIGPIRFYSLHVVDTAINRCGIEPMTSRAAQSVLSAVYALWLRMGIPENLQVDNELVFYGSPTHPRGMGTAYSSLPALWCQTLVHSTLRAVVERSRLKIQRPLPAEVSRQSHHVLHDAASERIAGVRGQAQQHLSLQQAQRENSSNVYHERFFNVNIYLRISIKFSQRNNGIQQQWLPRFFANHEGCSIQAKLRSTLALERKPFWNKV